MITEEHIKEGISRAYTKMVAFNTGLNCVQYDFDYGIDGTFKEVKMRNNRYVDSGVAIDFQLKATINVEEEDKYIKYKLEAKNYNDLVDEEVSIPRILILYVLPKEREEWIRINQNETKLKNCAWWYSLKGNKLTNNSNTITIRIPKNQLLTSESLANLIQKVKRGEKL